MNGKYILVDGKPKLEPDLMKWANWYETANRIVEVTHVGDMRVSTVFLALDHAFSGGLPLLWETMTFPSDSYAEQDMRRYTTLADAKKGHWEVVDELRRKLEGAPA